MQHRRKAGASRQNRDRTTDRVLKPHSDRLPGGIIPPVRGKRVASPAGDPVAQDRSRWPWAGGGRLAGALAPGRSRWEPGDMEGAMAPAIVAGHPGMVRNPAFPGGIRKRDPRFPARAERCPADRWVQASRKASARPGGREAPAGGGSGAGRGLWPPAGPDPGLALWQGRWPLPLQRVSDFTAPGGIRKRTAFPRPLGTVPCRPVDPEPTKGQRPPGAGRALAGGFGPRLDKDQRGSVAGAMAPARMRKARAGRKRFPLCARAAPAAGTFSAPCYPRRRSAG